jgi:hypothetical protein
LTIFVTDSVSDYESLRHGNSGNFGLITLLGFALCAFQFLMSCTIYQWWSRPSAREWSPDRVRRSVRNVTLAAFGVTFGSAVAFVIFDTFGDTCSFVPPAVPVVGLVLTFLLTTAMAFQLARSQPR